MGNVSNLAEAREARRLQKPRTNDGKGFALLHRKIMDVPFYKDAEAAHLWVHLLLRANHEQTLVSTDVQPGNARRPDPRKTGWSEVGH